MDKPLPAHYKVPRPPTDKNLSWDVVAAMWQHTNFYEDEAAYRRFTAPATPGQLAIFATAWYLSEVFNGGHDQFFFNSTGMVWRDAVDGFSLLGAEAYSAILAEALAEFPNAEPSLDHEAREAQLESIGGQAWDELDERLYNLEDPYEDYATRYINAHPDHFFTNP